MKRTVLPPPHGSDTSPIPPPRSMGRSSTSRMRAACTQCTPRSLSQNVSRTCRCPSCGFGMRDRAPRGAGTSWAQCV
eukprot:4746105-Pleurochrysis_carterae.AAC.1